MALRIDYTNMLSGAVAGGIPVDVWEGSGPAFDTARAGFERRRAAGELGFLDLPHDDALHAQSTSFAARVRGMFDDIVLLGIGGSALGPIALRTALRPSAWNDLTSAQRQGCPRLWVLDNVDPRTIGSLLERIDLRRALFIVTSKSGGTAETMAQYLIVRGRLDETLGGDATRHLVFVTDPEKGALRELARRERIAALDIPPNVGGRFSVLSPVGILPAALIGIDTGALLRGAGEIARRCVEGTLAANPAGVFAMLQWLADTRLGRHIDVLMPYADALRDFADWFVQLWAESLGKQRPDGSHAGPTPIAALGATDQHSQVQLFMQGPADKTVSFIAVEEIEPDLRIPPLDPGIKELGYLGGHHLGELLKIEQRATAGALAARGRPNLTIHVDRVDPWHLGALIMVLEAATIYAGELFGVNPLDQPGVELGKQFTYGMLGRADAERARQEWNMLPEPDPRWSV